MFFLLQIDKGHRAHVAPTKNLSDKCPGGRGRGSYHRMPKMRAIPQLVLVYEEVYESDAFFCQKWYVKGPPSGAYHTKHFSVLPGRHKFVNTFVAKRENYICMKVALVNRSLK